VVGVQKCLVMMFEREAELVACNLFLSTPSGLLCFESKNKETLFDGIGDSMFVGEADF
jgi:hypothetical protein